MLRGFELYPRWVPLLDKQQREKAGSWCSRSGSAGNIEQHFKLRERLIGQLSANELPVDQ